MYLLGGPASDHLKSSYSTGRDHRPRIAPHSSDRKRDRQLALQRDNAPRNPTCHAGTACIDSPEVTLGRANHSAMPPPHSLQLAGLDGQVPAHLFPVSAWHGVPNGMNETRYLLFSASCHPSALVLLLSRYHDLHLSSATALAPGSSDMVHRLVLRLHFQVVARLLSGRGLSAVPSSATGS